MPMNRVPYELLAQQATAMRFERNIRLKTEKLIEVIGAFLIRMQQDMSVVEPLLAEVHQGIKEHCRELQTS
ncbi:hypothetical protein D3C71_2120240 [compost metagenome]